MDHTPANHPTIPPQRVGVLLVNLGTPDATDVRSMRRYLREFLSDRRVIDANPIVWQAVLNLIILPFRPKRSARVYQQIWDTERNESPLRTFTRAQSEALSTTLGSDHPEVSVDWAMRYGTPSIASRIHALFSLGCRRILLFPLYPQYSAATTATACDKAFDALKAMRWQPAVRTAAPYYDAPDYIDTLSESVTAHLATLDWQPDVILASYHGLPADYLDKGDPYHCHCAKTTRLLRDRLELDQEALRMTFQSRFGPREWLKPYTDVVLQSLPAQGARRVAVVTPGFAADCVETLEEIAIRGRETFMEAGGEQFTAIPCLNADAPHIAMLADLIRRELAGWI